MCVICRLHSPKRCQDTIRYTYGVYIIHIVWFVVCSCVNVTFAGMIHFICHLAYVSALFMVHWLDCWLLLEPLFVQCNKKSKYLVFFDCRMPFNIQKSSMLQYVIVMHEFLTSSLARSFSNVLLNIVYLLTSVQSYDCKANVMHHHHYRIV